MANEDMIWDLSQMVEFDDPAYISERLTALVKVFEEYRDQHRGKVKDYNAQQVFDMIEQGDNLWLQYEGPFNFSWLGYQADMSDDVAKKLFEKYRQSLMLVQKAIAFVELELGKLISEKPEVIEAPELSEFKHILEQIQRKIPYMLEEELEQLIIAKDLNGIRAWNKLFSDWLATRTFNIEVDSEMKTMPYGEILGLYQSSDRDLRKRAQQVVYETLSKDALLWSSSMLSVFKDHHQMTKLRKWPTPMTQSLIANDVDDETIDALMTTIENNVGVLQKYLRLKAKVMGFEKLGNWDITAPLPNAPEKKYTWAESRKLVVDAYLDFDKESGDWMDEMYERRHIDAEVRKGKTSGAFCSTWHKGQSAYILQSFNGIMSDVFTSAHELGHALHAYLGTRAQRPSNYEIGSCIAETGSIFGEILLAEKLLADAKTSEEKQAILSIVLDEFGEAGFQVSARVFFETSIYDAIEDGKFLDAEKISDLWVAARDKIYGDSVEWLPIMRYWWTMKQHFYMPNYRYYNYPYVYAQLFVYAMYRLYKEEGKEFVPKLKALLAAGSSRSPRDLAADIGFDITKEEFWQKGIDQYAEFIKLFEETL
ncbi:MAG: M3 family oligoendopeptidase [Candidatus Thorarchaeota archaeon]|jgi:oligoendopeptidase F